MIAFPAILAAFALLQRARWPEFRKALKYGLDLRILFLLYAVMLYKAAIDSSGAAKVLVTDMQAMGAPALVILATLPMLMGLATGASMGFAGVALPLLVPYIALTSGINGHALLLAYVSGFIGVLLSPVHLCLVLSAQYFKANLTKVYRYILPPCMFMEAIVIILYYVVD